MKTKKEENIFCPNCGSEEVGFASRAKGGLHQCKECGFTGGLFGNVKSDDDKEEDFIGDLY